MALTVETEKERAQANTPPIHGAGQQLEVNGGGDALHECDYFVTSNYQVCELQGVFKLIHIFK